MVQFTEDVFYFTKTVDFMTSSGEDTLQSMVCRWRKATPLCWS